MNQSKNVFSEFIEDREQPKPKKYDPFNVGEVVQPLNTQKPETTKPQKKRTTTGSQNPFDEFVK